MWTPRNRSVSPSSRHRSPSPGRDGRTVHHVQPLRLRKFSGDRGQPAEDFIKEIELMLTLCPMDNGPACLQIIGALEGRARRHVTHLPDTEINRPRKIISVLREVFGDHQDVASVIEKFYSRRQLSREGVSDYALGVYALYNRANELDFDGIPELRLRDRFVRGLSSSYLRREVNRFVRIHHISDFADVKEEALRLEREEFEEEDSHTHRLSASPEADQGLRAEVNRLAAQVAQLTVNKDNGRQGDARNTSGGAAVSSMLCFWCERPGHREAECEIKRRYRERQQRWRRDRGDGRGGHDNRWNRLDNNNTPSPNSAAGN